MIGDARPGSTARKLLLAIDGGGIRGVIPLAALVALERTTGRLARETFSFVAGTSTGAIIAAGIAAGIPAERLLELYCARAATVFPQRPWNPLVRLLFGSMYSVEALSEVIAEASGPARDWRLDDAPIDLLITAKRVSDGMPWYFVRNGPRNSGRTGHLRLVDCVTASAAAPTYFAPWTIREDPELLRRRGWQPIGALVDGGVGVTGNPVYQACVEAFYYTDRYTPDNTAIVSLGTGRYRALRQPGWLGAWLEWLLAELLRSPGEQQTELVARHFPQTPFYRLDLDLERDIPLDDVRRIDLLVRYGNRFADPIDWPGILAGTDTRFRVTPERTLWPQYTASLA